MCFGMRTATPKAFVIANRQFLTLPTPSIRRPLVQRREEQ